MVFNEIAQNCINLTFIRWLREKENKPRNLENVLKYSQNLNQLRFSLNV